MPGYALSMMTNNSNLGAAMNKHSVTLFDGDEGHRTATRNSKTRIYTHVLVAHHTAESAAIFNAPGHWSSEHPAHAHRRAENQQWVISWHGSYANAQKAQVQARKRCVPGSKDLEGMLVLIVSVDCAGAGCFLPCCASVDS